MSNTEVRQVPSQDSEILELWERVTGDEHILGVTAVRLGDDSWPWQVTVSAARCVTTEALVSQLEEVVSVALGGVSGVDSFEHEERAVWVVAGNLEGRDLVLAVSAAVDSLASRLRADCSNTAR